MNMKESLTLYNREYCGDLGKFGAHCNHAFTSKPRDIKKDQWDKERVGQICVNSQAYTDIGTLEEQVCVIADCTYEEREMLRQADRRFKKVIDRAKAARKTLELRGEL
jgi:hypothetical protein